MGRLVRKRATQEPIEYQSRATPGTVTSNALNDGFVAGDIEEVDVTEAEWLTIEETWYRGPARTDRSGKKSTAQTGIDAIKTKLSLSDAEWATIKDAIRYDCT